MAYCVFQLEIKNLLSHLHIWSFPVLNGNLAELFLMDTKALQYYPVVYCIPQ